MPVARSRSDVAGPSFSSSVAPTSPSPSKRSRSDINGHRDSNRPPNGRRAINTASDDESENAVPSESALIKIKKEKAKQRARERGGEPMQGLMTEQGEAEHDSSVASNSSVGPSKARVNGRHRSSSDEEGDEQIIKSEERRKRRRTDEAAGQDGARQRDNTDAREQSTEIIEDDNMAVDDSQRHADG